ncbi:nuclear transport factor 2 family protein [Bradyrhizobium sp.]|jgi:ketosteroid isomerase-like protein|uniref:nuclear transport factor 2 family protein n=1 Tax=Bradyrhizobium sp. TaxID=376 RepID=UPI003C231218
MYHAIVRRKLRHVFSSLCQGNFEPGLDGLASRFDHVFSGTHALGGTRHTKAGMRRWFARLFLLFPKLDFTIKHIAVCGPPWNTCAMVEWQDTATPADGVPYFNDGTHFLRLRWGKVVSLHAYLDTQVVADTCRRLAEWGLADAAAPPIED